MGDSIDKRMIRNKAQLDTCNPSDLEGCDESELNDFLNLGKEIKAWACSNHGYIAQSGPLIHSASYWQAHDKKCMRIGQMRFQTKIFKLY